MYHWLLYGTKKNVRINRVFELSEVKITKKDASKSLKLKVLDVWDKDGGYKML